LALEIGCIFDVAVYIEKEPEKTDASKLAPDFFSGFFFSLLRKPAELRSADCRLVVLSVCLRTLPHGRCAQQADHACVIASAKRIEKEA